MANFTFDRKLFSLLEANLSRRSNKISSVQRQDHKEAVYLPNICNIRKFPLPGSTGSSCLWHVASHLCNPRENWRWHWWGEGGNIGSVGSNVILVGSELTTFSGDTLQVFLGGSIGIANLQKQAFIANWLPMKLLDNLFADIATLKASMS
jgi:hypothetical protein